MQKINNITGTAYGIVKITDLISGNIIVHNKNAIHFGNISMAIAKALAGDDNGHIRWISYGNGATSITANGTIFYRAPNTSDIRDESASLYNETFLKDVSVDTPLDNISVELTSSQYADIVITSTLGFGEPASQDLVDNATNNDGDYVFDEIGVKTAQNVLIAHNIFHPVQKSLNRLLEIQYTLRIVMG